MTIIMTEIAHLEKYLDELLSSIDVPGADLQHIKREVNRVDEDIKRLTQQIVTFTAVQSA